MTNDQGETLKVYDHVDADTVTAGDQILVNDVDYVEVNYVVNETDTVMVRGYSHVTGDSVTYFLPFDQEVGLWMV